MHKRKEMFRITISKILRPLELGIETYQLSPEGKYVKLASGGYLPSKQLVKAELKKRMVDGEPLWAVEILIEMVK